jgi:hypothetical protein
VSRMNGFVLDVAGGKAEPGAKVITYPRHGKPNQMWDYDKVTFLSVIATSQPLSHGSSSK